MAPVGTEQVKIRLDFGMPPLAVTQQTWHLLAWNRQKSDPSLMPPLNVRQPKKVAYVGKEQVKIRLDLGMPPLAVRKQTWHLLAWNR